MEITQLSTRISKEKLENILTEVINESINAPESHG